MGAGNQPSEPTGNGPYIEVISTHFGKGGKTERQCHHYLTFQKPKETSTYTGESQGGGGHRAQSHCLPGKQPPRKVT